MTKEQIDIQFYFRILSFSSPVLLLLLLLLRHPSSFCLSPVSCQQSPCQLLFCLFLSDYVFHFSFFSSPKPHRLKYHGSAHSAAEWCRKIERIVFHHVDWCYQWFHQTCSAPDQFLDAIQVFCMRISKCWCCPYYYWTIKLWCNYVPDIQFNWLEEKLTVWYRILGCTPRAW